MLENKRRSKTVTSHAYAPCNIMHNYYNIAVVSVIIVVDGFRMKLKTRICRIHIGVFVLEHK